VRLEINILFQQQQNLQKESFQVHAKVKIAGVFFDQSPSKRSFKKIVHGNNVILEIKYATSNIQYRCCKDEYLVSTFTLYEF